MTDLLTVVTDRQRLLQGNADQPEGGPWGPAMDVILCLLPIAFLLVATLKRNPLPTTVSLPAAAVMLLLVRLMYLGSDPLLVCASIIQGLHEALAPLSIMCGAIFLFETMESTLCMPFMLREMKALSQGHPIAETMLLFCFAYMVEGAAGFGTPAALGAPMLASLGYKKLDAVVLLLMFNTLATVWGAVGTPIWFGFGNLGLSEKEYIDISYRAGVALFLGGLFLLPTMALRVVCPWSVIKPNLPFVAASFVSCAGLSMGLSFASYEFPSLVGGMVGCAATGMLITFKVGLRAYEAPVEEQDVEAPAALDTKKMDEDGENSSGHGSSTMREGVTEAFGPSSDEDSGSDGTPKNDEYKPESSDDSVPVVDTSGKAEDRHLAAESLLAPHRSWKEGYFWDVTGRTFPLWGTVLLLMLTRIDQVGLKDLLTRTEPSFIVDFGTYGIFKCSASLVLQLQNILTLEGVNWKFALLYIPFILPFFFISGITLVAFRKDIQTRPHAILGTTARRLHNPAIALFGALCLVKLLINGGTSSPAYLIGTILSDALKEGWVVIACFVGMLGSFFSGSTTVSNLTFGGIQLIAAQNIGVSPTAMLALQATGGSAGNGICLNNIIAACAVVGLKIDEGKVIARTGPFVLALGAVSTLVMLAFFIRFN